MYFQIILVLVISIFCYFVCKQPVPQVKDYLNKILYKPNINQTDQTDKTAQTDQTATTDCAICMDKITTKDYIYDLSCDHKYHFECLDQYLDISKSDPKCPLCRQSIISLIR
jgi:hypothetical protein